MVTQASGPVSGPVEQRAGRKEWIGFAVLALPLLLVSMDVSVLYFAVPFLSRDLAPTATQQLWIFDVYGFVLAGLLLTMGSLGDRIGRRRLLLIGAIGFSLASLGAAYSQSAPMLIAARAVLGIAGATLMPSTLGLIRNMFHDAGQRSKAIALWTGVMTGGIALGPVLSGLLLEHFWWGSVFLINLPAMLLLLILGPMLLPEHRSAHPGRFDLPSAALSLLTVLPAIYGIKEWAAQGFSWKWLGCIVFGLAVGALFLVRQRRTPDPMLDLGLFRGRQFGGSILVNTVAMFALVGNAVFMTQFLQSVLGLTPLVAALWSLAPSVLVGAAAPVGAVLGQRFDRASVMAGGFLVAAGGFGLITAVTPHSPLMLLLLGAGLLAGGLVVVMTLVTEIAMGAMDPARAGSASAVLETGSEFGGALGIAVLGSIGAAIYRAHLALPGGLSARAIGQAHETLADAGVVASSLDRSAGEAVLLGAREAFTAGMHGVSVVGAAVLVGAAVCCVALLRHAAVDTRAPSEV
ncbi:DHA2 family multidrug resistance protein-like MFS transporter [Nakamurella sp. UYEF19]|uniref:MFS transporter n=1 Tax=Nakamurella sp. UYEF19 TaxID=1756392 RepID=UPI003392F7BE